jgi:hypothetical protein
MDNLIQYERQFEAIAGSMNPYPVNFDDAWVWVGYGRKDYALDALKANFKEGVDYSRFNRNRSKLDKFFDSGLDRNQKPGRGGDRRSVYYKPPKK